MNANLVFLLTGYSFKKVIFPSQGDLLAQTGDETEPKRPPKLAKKRPSEVEGRPKIGPRVIREVRFDGKSLFFFF